MPAANDETPTALEDAVSPTGAASASPSSMPRARRRRWPWVALGALIVALGVARAWPAPVGAQPDRPVRVARTPHAERDASIFGDRIRYIDIGPRDGVETPLVLLPGHTSRIEEYDAISGKLAAGRRVLCLDFPGTGYSDKPARAYTLDHYEEVLIGFLDAMGIAKANLAGGSLGANLALRLGRRAPARFARLLPWAPGSAWPARPLSAAVIRAAACYALFLPSVEIQSTYWYDPGWAGREAALASTFAYYDEVMGPGFIDMYWGLAADTVEHSLFDVAAQVPLPTLLLWGTEDSTPGMAEGLQRIHDLLPRSELRAFEGAPHALASHMPDTLVEVLEEFLRRPEEELP